MVNRSGESGVVHLRVQRFYPIGKDWLFSTRENLHIGPYKSLDDAEIALALFIRHQQEASDATVAYRQAAHS